MQRAVASATVNNNHSPNALHLSPQHVKDWLGKYAPEEMGKQPVVITYPWYWQYYRHAEAVTCEAQTFRRRYHRTQRAPWRAITAHVSATFHVGVEQQHSVQVFYLELQEHMRGTLRGRAPQVPKMSLGSSGADRAAWLLVAAMKLYTITGGLPEHAPMLSDPTDPGRPEAHAWDPEVELLDPSSFEEDKLFGGVLQATVRAQHSYTGAAQGAPAIETTYREAWGWYFGSAHASDRCY